MQYDLTWSSDALNRWPCTLLFHDRPYLSVQLSKQVLQDSVRKNRLCNWKRWDKAKIRPGSLPFFRVSLENQLWSALLCWICGQWQRTTHSDWPPLHQVQYSTTQNHSEDQVKRISRYSITLACIVLSNPPWGTFYTKLYWATSQGGSFTWSRRMLGIVKYEYISWRGLCCNDKRTLRHITSPAQ